MENKTESPALKPIDIRKRALSNRFKIHSDCKFIKFNFFVII